MNYGHSEDIRRCKNGTIDYLYYSNIGRLERSRQAYKLSGSAINWIKSIITFESTKNFDKSGTAYIKDPDEFAIRNRAEYQMNVLTKKAA